MEVVSRESRNHQRSGRQPEHGCLARLGCILLLLALLVAPAALAQTWDGGDTNANSNWSNATNWVGDAAPANNGTANISFAGSVGLSPVLDTNWSINRLIFTNNAGAYTLTSSGGATLTIQAGGMTNHSANVQTINIGNITLGAAQTWNARSNHFVISSALANGGFLLTIDGANNTTLSGALSGTGGLTKIGTGTLTLSGDSTLSGTITLSAGTLAIGHDAALGTGGLTIAANTTIQSDGSPRTIANTVTASGNFTVGGASDLAFSGDVNLSANRTITVNNTGVTTISGRLGQTSGTPTFTKAGSGTLVLSGSNNLANTITVSAGVLNVRHANALGTTGSGTVVSSGAALELEGGISIGAEALTLSGSGISLGGALRNTGGDNSFAGALTLGAATIIASDSGTLTLTGNINNGGFGLTNSGAGGVVLSGVVSGAGGLIKTGAGTLTLSGSGANTYDGDTLVLEGTLLLNKSVANGTVTSTLTIGTATDAPYAAIARHLSSLQVDSGKGTGLTLKNSGWLDLNGFNDTIKITSLEGGRITTGSGTLTLASHVTYAASATNSTVISGNLALGANRDFNVNDGAQEDDLVIEAAISGAYSLKKKNQAGRLVLSGNNTYTGSTTVEGGPLKILHDNALGSTNGTTTVNSGAALEVAGNINVGAQALTLSGSGVGGTGALRQLRELLICAPKLFTAGCGDFPGSLLATG
jgi:fibronectin-binding autotransporter adhesin